MVFGEYSVGPWLAELFTDKAGCRADCSGFYSAVSNYFPEVNVFNLNSSCHCEGGKKKKKMMASMSSQSRP